MKRNVFILLSILTLIATLEWGCSDKVEVIGVWKDIPVVYGVIDDTKDTNYIRIERAYLPPNRSAIDVGNTEPDSLYFDTSDIQVNMYQITLTGDTTLWIGDLERVDLKAEGIVRDTGLFVDDPAYAYRLIGRRIQPYYHLEIINSKTGNTFTATTETTRSTNSFLLISPAYNPISLPLALVEKENDEFKFGNYVIDLTEQFATIYDVGIRFFYKEYEVNSNGDTIPGTMENKKLEWKARRSYVPAGTFDVAINGSNFFNTLQNELTPIDGTNKRRCAGGIEVYVDGASTPLKDYLNALTANQGTVGGLYPVDPYSNVTNGYGVFATSDRLEKEGSPSSPRRMELSPTTYEYFNEGEMTEGLGFESTTTPCFQ